VQQQQVNSIPNVEKAQNAKQTIMILSGTVLTFACSPLGGPRGSVKIANPQAATPFKIAKRPKSAQMSTQDL